MYNTLSQESNNRISHCCIGGMYVYIYTGSTYVCGKRGLIDIYFVYRAIGGSLFVF